MEVDRALLGCLDFRALVVRLTLLVFSIRHSLSLQACQREREGNEALAPLLAARRVLIEEGDAAILLRC